MTKAKPAGNKTRDLVVRIVIFSALGVILVLALLDYQAKSQATETGTAWRDMLEDADENHATDLPLDRLAESTKGSPAVAESQGKNVYTWKGPFRSYEVTVHYETDTPSKSISKIEGL